MFLTPVLLAHSAVVHAQSWTPIATGVDYAEFTSGGTAVDAVRIDLCAPGVRLRATAPGEGPRTVSSYGQLVGAAVAINGDWWSNDGEPQLPDTYPRALAVGDSHAFEGPIDRPSYGVVAFGMNTVLHSAMEEDLGPPHWWMQDAVSGQPTLVWDGARRDNPTNHCGVRRARTAVGFDQARTTMYMAVVQEVNGSVGMTCNEMGSLMQSLGAYSALNQDGGGSSTMWLHDRGVVNAPSDGAQRSLVNHWAVMAPGIGPPRSCVTREIPPAATGVKRKVADLSVYAAWKFQGGDLGLMGLDMLAQYPDGEVITAAPRWLQHSDSSLWLADGAFKRRVLTFDAINAWRIDPAEFVTNADAELAELTEGPPLVSTPVLILEPEVAIWLIDHAPPDAADPDGDDSDPDGPMSDDDEDDDDDDAGGDDAAVGDLLGGCSAASPAASWFMLPLLALLGILCRRRVAVDLGMWRAQDVHHAAPGTGSSGRPPSRRLQQRQLSRGAALPGRAVEGSDVCLHRPGVRAEGRR